MDGKMYLQFQISLWISVIIYEISESEGPLDWSVTIIIIITTSTSDLQPSTAIANQLPNQSASTQTRTIGVKLLQIQHCIDSV